MKALILLRWLKRNPKTVLNAILALSVAFLISFSAILHKQNKTLSDRLEMANNNIEAYLGLIKDSLLAFNVLKLDFEDLLHQNDIVLLKLDSVRKELKLKSKQINVAATLTQHLNVNGSKETNGQVVVKDTIYSDSIKYNDLTTVYYTIGNDTINIGLDILNEQFLFVYSKREYKNKKKFFKRLFTLDFKKVTKYKYDLLNTNDLLKSSDVRIIESKDK